MSFFQKFYAKLAKPSIWARPQMSVTFRAELMPGKDRSQRTFRIDKVLNNGRVILEDFAGEHRETEFEPVSFKK